MIAEYAEQAKHGATDPHQALLGDGTWNSADDQAGRPSIQGLVAYKGATGRFDEAVGRNWYLLTDASAASETLTSEQLAKLEKVGGSVLTVGPRGSNANVIDLDGSYAAWFAKNNRKHLLVRPDYFVAATANSESEIRSAFDIATRNLVA
jgi:3-(3-hydroxy-phenyl)propionate hydroxylase